jgi:YHS domain-containing protein
MKYLFFLLLFISFSFAVFAQKGKASDIFVNDEGAIKGFDPVAYFNQKQAIKGQKSIAFEWKGASWHFTTEENKALFIQNPEQYAPQYGGYCAYGWAKGYAAKIEPDAWTIVDGKLYLNYDKGVQKKWEKNIPGYIKQADDQYQKKQQGKQH